MILCISHHTPGSPNVGVTLDSAITKVQLFPGQIACFEGDHTSRSSFVAKKIIDVCMNVVYRESHND